MDGIPRRPITTMKYQQHHTKGTSLRFYRATTLRSYRAGTSLLELVLALVVAMVILTLAMGVIQMQGRLQKAHRAKAEKLQLARAVLKHVAGDLRHAMSSHEFDATGISTLPDISSLMSLSASSGMTTAPGLSGVPTGAATGTSTGSPSTSGTNTSSGATGSTSRGPAGSGTTGPTDPAAYQLYGGQSGVTALGSGGGGSGSSPSGGTPTTAQTSPSSGATTPVGGGFSGGTTASTATAGASTSGATAATPSGLGSDFVKIYFYGTADRLEFDASRLPRIDEYQGFGYDNGSGSSDASLSDITSDVKTVSFYVGSLVDAVESADLTFGEQEFSADDGSDQPSTGLIRSEVDRSASLYATLEATGSQLDKAAEVVAPEVSAVLFRYFDGYEWWDEWDSDVLGGIPTAVEIDLTLRGESEEEEGDHYLLVVRLPASQRIALEEAELAQQQAESAAADATADGTQAAGAPAAGGATAAPGMTGAAGFGAAGGMGMQGGFGVPGAQGMGGQGPGGQGQGGPNGGQGGRGGRGGQGGRGGGGQGGRGGGGGGQNGGFGGGFGGGGRGGGGMGGAGMGGGGMGGAGMGGGGMGGGFGGPQGGGS